MEETIKNIYNCSPLKGDDALVVWYNNVIEKRAEELTVADVARCVRQKVFVETAYEVLLAYLLRNPYEGDVYEGELMDKASEVDQAIIKKYNVTLSEIINKANSFISNYDWLCEEDKAEFTEAVHKLNEIIQGYR